MDYMACVSSSVSGRTRSKKVLSFLNLSYVGSSSSESKREIGDKEGRMGGTRKRGRILEKRVRVESDVIFIGEEGEGAAGLRIEPRCIASSSSPSRGLKGKTVAKPGFVCAGKCEGAKYPECINLDDSDDDGYEAEEELRSSQKTKNKRFKVEDDDIHLKEKEKSEEGKKGYVFGDKVANFGNVDYDGSSENPITISIDSDEESESGAANSSDDECDSFWSSSESEDEETSDEDFHVDDGSEDQSSENSGYSDDDDDDERENLRRTYNKIVKEHVIKVETGSNEIYRKNYGRKNKLVEKEEDDNNCAYVTSNEWEIREEEKRREEKDVEEEDDENNFATVISNECEVLEEEEMREEEMREEKTVENVHSEDTFVSDYRENLECSMPSEDEALKDKKTQDKGYQSVSLQKETEDSTMVKNREKTNDTIDNTNDSVNLDANEGKEHHFGKGTGDSTMVKKSEKNNYANANECANPDPHEDKEHHQDKDTGVRSVSSLPKDQKKMGDSVEVIYKENKEGREHKHCFNSNIREKKVRVEDNEHGFIDERHRVHMIKSRAKEQQLVKLLAECFWGKNDSVKDESNKFEESNDDDDVPQYEYETQPPACRVTIPLNWSLMKKEPVEKSESEKELDRLWEEIEMLLKLEEVNGQVGNIGTNEAGEHNGDPATLCKHDFYIDEQVGILCRFCLWVSTEIKFVMQPFADRYCSEGSSRRVSSGEVNTTYFDGVQFNDSGGDSEAAWSLNEGTVWDLIPDIKQSLYPHQQEGFEFIWSRLAGTIDLQALKKVDPCNEGGCIISHAPGTGKTRLTMVFLQTYMQVFPKCLPVIIAPANLLLTWEDELRKWDIGIPFHNFNNHELSGNEHMDAANDIDLSGNTRLNKDKIRVVKLRSWCKDKSILLISYPLYEKLAGGMSEVDMEKEKKNWNLKKKKKRVRHRHITESEMGKVLRECPGLLVLDEGHTPRNQRSCIWKVLSESRTQKRILLSGTPFQNNFLELYNILCLMKPSFPDSIPQELKKFCQSRLMQAKKASKDLSWESVSSGIPADSKINQLKLLMDPFVHVHKGSILQKNLPGLRDCVLILKPDSLQKEILESIDSSQNILTFEHKLALVSVHPSLFLKCALIEKEESIVDKDQLEKLRLDPYEGVKTKFLMEFVRLCDAYNEKVIVFSQYIDTLCLIKDQLESSFKWSMGNEVLYMHGRLDQKQKQSLIHNFNDANNHVKILLASIKACSEGINLIGASRVVLLDVVWNPSVERQAICRAYRLGQKKVVYTYHLLSQGTPECAKYCKQAEKDRLSELVFSDKNTANDELKNCTVTLEDAVLDRMIQHEKLKDMFGECSIQSKERVLEGFGP